MIWTFYYPCENITWALLVVAKTIAFLSKNAVVSLVQSRGEGGHFKELRLPMRSTGIPRLTSVQCKRYVFSFGLATEEIKRAVQWKVFYISKMCKKKETISDERVAMFVGARIWSNCDLKMHSQICLQPDVGVPQYNSVGRDKPYTQALTTMLGNYLLI